VDNKTGTPFFGATAGFGIGGGFSYDPNGSTAPGCGQDFFGLTGDMGAQLGPGGIGSSGWVGWYGEDLPNFGGGVGFPATMGPWGIEATMSGGVTAQVGF